MLLSAALVILAYLLGSVSTAVITCRLMGLPDPRDQGSGNPGATNVLRIGGKGAAAVTLLGDMLKGLLPVLVARWVGAGETLLAAVGLAAFVGHLYPIFFAFKGGKGVATALGVLLGLAWPVGVAAIATWLIVAAVARISSLSALTSFLMVPLYMGWLRPVPPFIVLAVVVTLLLFWRHRGNIRSLLAGTEARIGRNR
jgi:acyl-phosphate glycerol 3-phosphate acyltransferase